MSILDKFTKKKGSPEKAVVAVKSDDTKKKTKKKTESKKAIVSISKLATQTLLKPVVTEKSAKLSDQGVVVFEVPVGANRVAVRQAFRELYKVTPVKINIINVRGKRVKFGRVEGKRQNVKKALISLPKGTRIDIFEGV